MHRVRFTSPIYVGLVLLAGLSGCGQKFAPVTGTVKYTDGKPLTGGMIVFYPANGSEALPADGQIKPDGTFTLRTKKPGDGVMPGEYTVGISGPPIEGDFVEEGTTPPPAVDPKFTDPQKSGLKATVPAEGGTFTFTVSAP